MVSALLEISLESYCGEKKLEENGLDNGNWKNLESVY
jgi:hypothetical protein